MTWKNVIIKLSFAVKSLTYVFDVIQYNISCDTLTEIIYII